MKRKKQHSKGKKRPRKWHRSGKANSIRGYRSLKKMEKLFAKLEEKVYRVDVEFPIDNESDGYKYLSFHEGLETDMRKLVQKMRGVGMGGRLVLLDGTPDGNVEETWGSPARLAAARKIENRP
jgi:hypothetical protein